ncbi:MAG TPA: transglycosylase SLT domain-containing protein [Candidatus Angelobacter sp.]|jgi:hypothetical protein|nr:transglycosylase SLT domain-containing protein [Candidatus Angelobacter sp.]
MAEDANPFAQFDSGDARPSPAVLAAAVDHAGQQHDVDPDLIHLFINQESGGDPRAVSTQGAAGLMQLMPETAATLGVRDLFNWRQSLDAGTRYLKQGLNTYNGRVDLAAAYYHGGPDVDQWGPKTADYSDRVMQAYQARKAAQQQQRPTQETNPFAQFDKSPPQQVNPFAQFDKPAPATGTTSDAGRPLTSRQTVSQMPMAKTEAEAPVPPGQQAQTPLVGGPTPEGKAIIEAAKEGWQNTPDLLTPMAQQWADAHGLGGDARALGWVLKGFNAAWSGATETANQIGTAFGQPLLGRDAAAMIETAGMTGAPHVPLREALRGMPESAAPAEVSREALADIATGKPEATPNAGLPTLQRMAAEATERQKAAENAAVEDTPKPPVTPEARATEELQAVAEPAQAAAPEPVKPAPVSPPPEVLATPPQESTAEAARAAGVTEPEIAANPFARFDEPAVSENTSLFPEAEPLTPAPKLGNVTPYEPIPREPTRLINFLRQPTVLNQGTVHETTLPGGLQDAGGDLKAILGGTKGRPGLISKNGRTLDDAALMAWESGYLPGAERPDTNMLLDAIRDDHNGVPRYSEHDLDRVEAYHAATERNAEIDRLSTEHENPTAGRTRDQFFDDLADRMSTDDFAREIAAQDDAGAAAYAEFEKQAKSVASEARNARDFYGQSQARSLEDLEREYASETAAPALGQHEASGEQPGLAGEPSAAGQESNAPRGGVTRDAGRTAAADHAETDILGKEVVQPRAKATPEPTIRNDTRQDVMPGMEPSARQAQEARDAQGRGALQSDVPQKKADEGLFAPDTTGQGTLYSFPGALFDPAAWRRAFGNLGHQVQTNPQFELLRDKRGIAFAAGEIRAGLAPTSYRGAKPMEYALRQHNAASAHAYDQSFHALEQVRAAVDKLPKDAQIEFTDRMERGVAQPTPELQTIADALRSQLDGWATKIQGLGKGYLANAVENYIGHIWGNYADWAAQRQTTLPQTAMEAQARSAGMRRQPLRGSGSFLKQRSFPTQLEGIAAGLEPVTFNPVDLQLIKLHEMQKFYHGTVLADRMKAERLATWVPATAQAERDAAIDGYKKLDDTIFKPRMMGQANNAGFGRLEPGNYWAPEPIARVFNNYMSQGWHGQSVIYDGVRRGNNALNTMQLGFSGFHAAFVTADTAISKVALGLQQAAAGHPIRGLGNMFSGATIGHAMVSTVRKGSELRRAWLDPANATPEMQQVVKALEAGGGRIGMPEFYQTSASGSFFRNLSDLKNPQSVFYQAAQMFRDSPGVLNKAIMVPLRLAGRAIDTLNQPLMGTLVPRAKLGVFADMAQNWLRDNPSATRERVAEAMTKFQDSVDNRLGQLNYDNLFWNKTAKDIAFITTRSVGWNLGTVREIGGSFVDSTSALKAIANGKAPQFSTRMAYTIALPIVTAEIGAIMTYLSTGQAPQSMLDYFYPPTGGQDDKGNVERRMIPGYMKDVIAAWKDLVQTALNKTSPLLETLAELRQNKDYYGGIIYDPQHDRPLQAYGDYLLNQTAPFSLRSFNKLHGEDAPMIDQALSFWGFQAAPKSITNPERGEMFQKRENLKGYRKRMREPGRLNVFNAPES